MIDLLPLLQTHGYWLLFFFMIIEGGIVKYIGAFAASLGIFDIYIVFLMGLVGNMVSDMFLFGVGRIGRESVVYKIIEHFGVKKEMIKDLKKNFHRHFIKTMIVIKTIPPFPLPGLLLAGASDVTAKRFFTTSLIITVVQSVIFTILGLYSGIAVSSMVKYIRYGTWIALAFLLIVGIIWITSRRFLKKISKKVESRI